LLPIFWHKLQCQIGPTFCFVIFVVLLDELDHFKWTFGEINVRIDSMAVPLKGVGTPALDIAHQTEIFGLNLPTALYFTASGVLSTLSVQKPSIPVKKLSENVKCLRKEIGSNGKFS
jgi:hypothetical protein